MTLTQIRKLAEFDESALRSKKDWPYYSDHNIILAVARYQHAQSAGLIELLLEIVKIQSEALEVMAEKHYFGVKPYSRTSENPYGEMIRDTTCEAALAKVRELVERYKV